MDESTPLEEIRIWEHPPWYGIDQFKEKVILTFLENQKGLFHNLKTHFRMPVKWWMISGPCQEASHTAITLNAESNFTRRDSTKIHWRFQKPLIRFWMSSKRSASMIIGIAMGLETCQILGQVSHNLLCWKKTSRRIYVVRVEIDEKTPYIQARSSMARTLEINGKACQAEGEAKVVWGKAPSWKRKKNARDLFHRPRGYGIQRNYEERA